MKNNKIELMKEANKKWWENASQKEKDERLKNARKVNKGSKRSEESKLKMSEANKKFRENNPDKVLENNKLISEGLNKISKEEKERIKAKRSESLKKFWKDKKENNPNWVKERNEKIANKNKGKKRSIESIEKQRKKLVGRKLSDEHKKAIADGGQNPYKNGLVKSGWYDVEGVKVQGKSEKLFLERRIEELKNGSLITHPKSIKTPYGYYRPDFENEHNLIEVKSSYTFKGLFYNYDKKIFEETNQFKKYLWVSENIKPLKIFVVETNRNEELEFEMWDGLTLDVIV